MDAQSTHLHQRLQFHHIQCNSSSTSSQGSIMEEDVYLPQKFQRWVCRIKGHHHIWGRGRFCCLKHRYVGYGGLTPNKMMQHICNKKFNNITTLEKENFNWNGYNTPWDNTTDINIYWKYLDSLTKNIGARYIATSGDEKVIVAVAQIWESN